MDRDQSLKNGKGTVRYMFDISKNAAEILESIDGFLLIDREERIVFMCKKLMKLIGADEPKLVIGKKLRDIISSNRTYRVLETGERQIGITYLVQGHTIVSNAYPVYKNGKLIGALEYDVFEDADLLRDFFDKMSSRKGLEHFGTAVAMRSRSRYTMDSIKGSSSVIRSIKNEILMSSRSASNVLITGETGTGKELIAQAIHMAGSRSLFEFVSVNCASIPPELFESELFGYEGGSFTGANPKGKKGLIALADKGTLFLDEVDTLPLPMQAKLLRFIQEREIRAVGGEKMVPVDVRIICASNADLSGLVATGGFRQDFYYRLNVFNIAAPALRDRRSDIPELVNHFIDELNSAVGRNLASMRIKSIDKEALKMLMDYDWPGNIRELKNVMERAMNRCPGVVLRKEDFSAAGIFAETNGMIMVPELDGDCTLRTLRKRLESEVIHELIIKRKLTITDAAKKLGLTRQMLHKKIRELDIRLDR